MIKYDKLIPVQREIGALEDWDRVRKMTPFLLDWYYRHKRILPWREAPLPYYVWVSEIMLQQTRVEAVKPYFSRFIESLPDVKALAKAEEEVLLKLWEGLGYYNRVRNMQKAAIKIMDEFGGQLPADYEKLLSLPGIGSYTAGAIASIAYGIPVPAVDGNVLRVMARLTASREDILKQAVKRKAEELLKANMPTDEAGAFNQAMMEIGATVCIPNGMAKCMECPIRPLCLANHQGIVMELPVKTPKKARRIEEKTVLILTSQDKVAIGKRGKKGLLAGLYEFPNLEGTLTREQVEEYLEENGMEAESITALPPAKHIFSHVEWHMTGYEAKVSLKEEKPLLEFVELSVLWSEYAIPNAFAAYKDFLSGKEMP